ncbi:hypothetical protein SRHO_G00079140 [Serrasalmus rhombeus]
MLVGGRVPLKSVEVEVQVKGHVATVTSTLQYVNEEELPMEALFVFPLPAEAALCHFSAKIANQEVVAEVQEKQKAGSSQAGRSILDPISGNEREGNKGRELKRKGCGAQCAGRSEQLFHCFPCCPQGQRIASERTTGEKDSASGT